MEFRIATPWEGRSAREKKKKQGGAADARRHESTDSLLQHPNSHHPPYETPTCNPTESTGAGRSLSASLLPRPHSLPCGCRPRRKQTPRRIRYTSGVEKEAPTTKVGRRVRQPPQPRTKAGCRCHMLSSQGKEGTHTAGCHNRASLLQPNLPAQLTRPTTIGYRSHQYGCASPSHLGLAKAHPVSSIQIPVKRKKEKKTRLDQRSITAGQQQQQQVHFSYRTGQRKLWQDSWHTPNPNRALQVPLSSKKRRTKLIEDG